MAVDELEIRRVQELVAIHGVTGPKGPMKGWVDVALLKMTDAIDEGTLALASGDVVSMVIALGRLRAVWE